MEKKRVALLTMDTYRIAAVEQLKIYSQILDIPIGVAYSQAEVAPVIAQYADFDLLLIDTAGRSQKNIMQVGELEKYAGDRRVRNASWCCPPRPKSRT